MRDAKLFITPIIDMPKCFTFASIGVAMTAELRLSMGHAVAIIGHVLALQLGPPSRRMSRISAPPPLS